MKTTHFLDPKQPLLTGVVQFLTTSQNLRQNPFGGYSLAHCMIVVPTAESGRQLRFALAKHFGTQGLLSPHIVLPSHLIQPAEQPYPIATQAEVYANLLHFLSTSSPTQLHERWPHIFYSTSIETAGFIGLTKQLYELWETLASNGLTFHDLATRPETQAFFDLHTAEEALRWKELAELENDFTNFLHIHGRCTKSEAFAKAKSNPLPLDSAIETLILPALADPLPILTSILEAYQHQMPQLNIVVLLHADKAHATAFDPWGRPLVTYWTDLSFVQSLHLETYLPKENINIYAQNNDLAEAAARHTLASAPDLPQLSILDERLFQPIKLAIEYHTSELTLHNPSLYPLSQSPLGRLTLNLITLFDKPNLYPWDTFVALLRSEDLLSYFATCHNIERTSLIIELNTYQNAFIPQAIDATFQSPQFPLLTHALALLHQLLSTHGTYTQRIRAFFRAIYTGRIFHPTNENKEFSNAISALTSLLNDFETPFTDTLQPRTRAHLFTALLKQTSYPLEPETTQAKRTVGWLELPWVDTQKLYLAGFNEGIVPDAIVGHPFLPDTLRAHLGLSHNDQRLARDTFLFSEFLRARPQGAVQIAVALATLQGDLLKPSRLLFLCNDFTFITRVTTLFKENTTQRSISSLQLPNAWYLNLSSPQPPETRMSASHLDAYLRCPFTYYLRYILKMAPKEPMADFSPASFGTTVHRLLRQFADTEAKNSDDPDIIFAALERLLKVEETHLALHHTKYLDLLIHNLRTLLRHFAQTQAAIRHEGWEICHVEYSIDTPLFPDLPFTATGIIDRIDYHPGKDIYRIIDYKTWEKEANEKIKDLLFVSQKMYIEHVKSLGYPLIEVLSQKTVKKKVETTVAKKAMRSVQLNFYKHILEKSDPKRYLRNNDAQQSRIQELAYFSLCASEANLALQPDCITYHNNILQYMRHALTRIASEKDAFWPPAPPFKKISEWTYDFQHLFLTSPEIDLQNLPHPLNPFCVGVM